MEMLIYDVKRKEVWMMDVKAEMAKFFAQVRERAQLNAQKIGYLTIWSMGKEERALFLADAALELVNESAGGKVLA